jgi:hypothetical protein
VTSALLSVSCRSIGVSCSVAAFVVAVVLEWLDGLDDPLMRVVYPHESGSTGCKGVLVQGQSRQGSRLDLDVQLLRQSEDHRILAQLGCTAWPATAMNASPVEWDHPAFFFNRINASLSHLVIALLAASRFKAELRLGCASCQTSLVGRRLRVDRDA